MAENAAIARPYAQAVFELASESGQLSIWSDALHAAAAVVSDEDFARLISEPGVDNASLVDLLAGISVAGAAAMGFTSLDKLGELIGSITTDVSTGVNSAARFKNLLKLLSENGRLQVLPDIANAFDSLKAEVENRVEVTLVAASPVDDAQRAKISDALQKRFGRDVSLTFKLDESLIGGARLQADDLVIDGSVSAGLEKLATTLAN